MYIYRCLFYPMVNQTLATVVTQTDDDYGTHFDQRAYTMKTFGDDPWPVAHLLRELADQLEAKEF